MLRQGELDLASARNSCRSGDYGWACFQSQQSAEKVLRSLLGQRGLRRISSHSVFEMVSECARFDPTFAPLVSAAKRLDGAYIITLYPDSLRGCLTPYEYFDRRDAQACIRSAAAICDAARRTLPG